MGARLLIEGNFGGVTRKNRVTVKDYKGNQVEKTVVNFSVVTSDRKFVNGEWVDGPSYWQNCTAWAQMAENIALLNKGDHVILEGKLEPGEMYEKDGEKRQYQTTLKVEHVGISIRQFPATAERKSSGTQQPYGSTTPAQQAAPAQQPVSKPSAAPFEETNLMDDDTPPF